MNGQQSEIDTLITSDADVRSADEFVKSFAPKEGLDYGWVTDYAKAKYDLALKVFDDLDAKASAIIGFVGTGTGLVTIGSVAGVSLLTVSPWVALAAIPAIIMACLSVVRAIHARSVTSVFPPPRADNVARMVEHFEDGSQAKFWMLGQWMYCTALMRPVLRAKAERVEGATWNFAVAVALLIMPLIVGVGIRIAN